MCPSSDPIVDRPREDLTALAASALAVGKQIDLSGCSYGDPHGDGPRARIPSEYYFFLAGLVRVQRLTHVLELGTHYGGAILAMSRGLGGDDTQSRLVTVDVACKNPADLGMDARIRPVVGDIFDRRISRTVMESFDRPIDLLFVDAGHDYRQVMTCLAIYANALQPRYIVLDDIRLCASMERVWRAVLGLSGPRAIDISPLVDRSRAGFGLIAGDTSVSWPENYSRWAPYWRLKRTLSLFLPEKVKKIIRRFAG